MTPTTLAETILRDVPRIQAFGGNVLSEDYVLAALTAAMDPALLERAGAYSDRLRSSCFLAFDDGTNDYGTAPLAADLLTAVLTQNAALRAEVRKSAMDAVSAGCQAQEAWEAQKAAEAERDALRAERDRYLRHLTAGAESLNAYKARAEAAEAQIATLTARVEGLTGAVIQRLHHYDEETGEDRCGCGACAPLFAALSATTEEGK